MNAPKLIRAVVASMLAVVGIIHLLPLPGVLGAAQLSALYGLDFSDPGLAILMRHRAVLFGLLGTACLIAAFRRSWQNAVIAAAAISTIAFLLLASAESHYGVAIARVVIADWIAVACLAVATVLRVIGMRRL